MVVESWGRGSTQWAKRRETAPAWRHHSIARALFLTRASKEPSEQGLVGSRAAISSRPLNAVSSCLGRYAFPLPCRFSRTVQSAFPAVVPGAQEYSGISRSKRGNEGLVTRLVSLETAIERVN